MQKVMPHGKFGKRTEVQRVVDMLGLKFDNSDPLNVLCLGAHCDDIEIGCGGTILELIGRRSINCYWVVFCSNEARNIEAQDCAKKFLNKVDKKRVIVKSFRDGFLPYVGYEVKDFFEDLKHEFSPDIIFTHYRQDKHQDHRIISELTLNTFRNHLILEYEIPKYDGDLGQPNSYMPISERNRNKKLSFILEHFSSQKNKSWFSEDLFSSLMRIRGMEVNSYSNYAEAFYAPKISLL